MQSTTITSTARRASSRWAFAAIGLGAALSIAGISLTPAVAAPDDFWVLPQAAFDPIGSDVEVAVLAGGCFWGIQAVYQRMDGVMSSVSGYSGGSEATATYNQVLRGNTGHAESVEVVFDPSVISYGEILRVFFSVAHDPTQLNRQGSDVGPHYRSHIYTTTAQQRQVAQAYVTQLEAASVYGNPIVTKVDPLTAFYPAEGYHQDYLENSGVLSNAPVQGFNNGYLVYWDVPKLINSRAVFAEYWRNRPVTVAQSRPDLVK